MSEKNIIAEAFVKGKAFIPFVTCGDPNLDVTEQLICAMADVGADLIELGIPFSDPTAEGPVIQAANERALATGVTTDKVFDMVARVQGKISIPLVFMTYANVLFSYGLDRFCKRAAQVGIAGVILPDVPYEEKAEFETVCNEYGLELVSLIAPNSSDRVAMIAKEAKGFVYCVSSLGVTGERSSFEQNLADMIATIRDNTTTPCAIGFGISTPEQAKAMAGISDGAIVGSAIVKLCAQHGADCVPYIAEYVKAMKQAL
ncbi:tryptophan synthase subunit alpha [Bengtsoniella intestinalis]|uniref:tryptophan synthase subunit alpha n=1 Tax=Bengtsoniella intestinalis TaxID=3073143 RepID=UPI00391EFF93